MSYNIRPFTAADIPQLLEMMRALAVFEDYIDGFAMDAETLTRWGLASEAKFHVFVADDGADLHAYAACYEIPYTYDARPTLVLKEMYAKPEARGTGAAQGVMQAVIDKARDIGAARLHWLVLPDNTRAQRFYRQFGGRPDKKFDNWHITFDAKS